MRARLLGWPGQVGIIFERKRFFERTLFEQKFSYIYTAYFLFEFSFEIRFFFEWTAFERKPKIRKVWKNGIRKKKMNFERTLFDQTTLSRLDTWLVSIYIFIILGISIIYLFTHFKYLNYFKPLLPARIFYRPYTRNKTSAVWIQTHKASEQWGIFNYNLFYKIF